MKMETDSVHEQPEEKMTQSAGILVILQQVPPFLGRVRGAKNNNKASSLYRGAYISPHLSS